VTSNSGRGTQALLIGAVLAAAVVGIGALAVLSNDRDPSPSLAEMVGDVDPGPIHVHGLGIDPADRSLFIATHTGMYRVAPDERNAELVGDSRQDTMGFTVAGPRRFLGSGHPDPAQARAKGLPPHLGLIESRDAGRTWQSVSLLGEADFHVLRFAGRRVYGYDAGGDRLLVSADAGRTWRQANRPAPLVDLAVAPRDPTQLVASSRDGLFFSRDGGQTWEQRSTRIGLLAWPGPRRLVLVSGTGEVFRSRNVRGPWAEIGNIGGEPAALLAQSAAELYAALHDGTIKWSRDGGRTWSVRSTP
jgi:BNR/Asp-box repeat